ncbi:amidohydrolase family protein [Phenylobacterium montanum]|uniref:Amidohydrolase family protein n=1 Tax=Phenylobacterium montanum TaxID=2823693 RepID=A0A975IW89_9CAUL|nr:amidohydrolase family protein [Caulobacter sp. S6]QUD89580.1 amidohydrolase family protein [Caulobacter sp. S6]
MHIASPLSVEIERKFCKNIAEKDGCDSDGLKASTGADALRSLDAAGIGRGALLSTAYMIGSPEVAEPPNLLAPETRAENAYVVEQARLSCDRLAAFISVNPNSPNALDEIRYWARTGGATGLKLHLANSGFDFNSPAQMANLGAVFEAANEARFPIVVHLRNRDPNYGGKAVEQFLNQILPRARGVTVQIAHAGGWGGVDAQTLSALSAFAEAIGSDPAGTRNLLFDLAYVPDLPDRKASLSDDQALAGLMRRIGLQRFLPASDWIKGMDLTQYYSSEVPALPLTPDEWREVLSNEAPYMRRLDSGCSLNAKTQ